MEVVQVQGDQGSPSIPALVRRNAKMHPTRVAFREKEFGIWQSWTWVETQIEVRNMALGLLARNVKPGEFVAIIGRNRPAHYMFMVAVQSVGAVPVPLYPDSVADEMAYVLDHCGATLVLCGDQEQVDKVLEVQQSRDAPFELLYTEQRGMRRYDHERLSSLVDLASQGAQAEAGLGAELDARIAALKPQDTCVMLYTSGTTGRPKGVILSNSNIVETSRLSSEFDNLGPQEDVLAYLPMAWIGDYIFSIGQAVWSGFCVNCPEKPETMMTDLREIGPTYFFAPPRVFETVLTQVQIRIEDAARPKRWLFRKAMDHARRVGPALLDGASVGLLDRVLYKFYDLAIYGPLKDTIGMSRVRIGYTAGEAIGPEIFSFYRSLGINLKQLYGQTEASVYIAQQPDGDVRADTVGVPSPGVEIRIDDKGEVFYRSPGVFQSYYKNAESTAGTKDAEGWVATGDAGFIEQDTGHLRIIDRAKDVGTLANGAMFAPKFVENKLKFFPEILEVVVFGQDRDFCTAFINIDLTAVGNWAERNNIAYASYQELAGHKGVLDIIQRHVEAVNASVVEDEKLNGCTIQRFLVLHKELDADDGELTQTRKVRRRVIAEKYDDLITALFDGSERIKTETEVTYEDGRKGAIRAELEIRDVSAAALAMAAQ